MTGDWQGPDPAAWRRWLWAYPRDWRDRHGEALLGTALDVADAAGRDRPTRREVADLVTQGLATRVTFLLPSPQVLRPAGTAAVALGGAVAVTALVLGELIPPFWPDELVPPYRPEWAYFASLAGRPGPLSALGPVVYALWLAVLAAVALGQRRTARVLLGAAAVAAVAVLPVAREFGLHRPPQPLLLVLFWCAVLGVVGLRRVPRVTAAWSTAGGVVLVATATLVSGGPPALLPAALEEATRWEDAYETFPFYAGEAGAVTGLLLMLGVLAALLAASAARRPHLVLAVLLLAPASLPWSRVHTWDLWVHVNGLGIVEVWTPIALTLPLVAVAADRLWRRRLASPAT